MLAWMAINFAGGAAGPTPIAVPANPSASSNSSSGSSTSAAYSPAPRSSTSSSSSSVPATAPRKPAAPPVHREDQICRKYNDFSSRDRRNTTTGGCGAQTSTDGEGRTRCNAGIHCCSACANRAGFAYPHPLGDCRTSDSRKRGRDVY